MRNAAWDLATVVGCLVLVLVGSREVAGCTIGPPTPPVLTIVSLGDTDSDGLNEVLLGVKLDDLFTPGVDTVCTCGLGLADVAGVSVQDAFVAINNVATGTRTLVPEFDFDPNVNATLGLNAGGPSGFDFTGFSVEVPGSFTAPTLGPSEALTLFFNVEETGNGSIFYFPSSGQVDINPVTAVNGQILSFDLQSQGPNFFDNTDPNSGPGFFAPPELSGWSLSNSTSQITADSAGPPGGSALTTRVSIGPILPSGWTLDQLQADVTGSFTGSSGPLDITVDGAPFGLAGLDFSTTMFAAGEGLADGSPNFGGAHPVEFFSAVPAVPGDFDVDGDVDGLDFLFWQRDPSVGPLSDWEANYPTPLTGAVSAVPEPATLMQFMIFATVLIRRDFWRPGFPARNSWLSRTPSCGCPTQE